MQVNFLHLSDSPEALQSALEPFDFTSEKRLVLQGLIDQRIAELTNEHVRPQHNFVTVCELTLLSVQHHYHGYRTRGYHRGMEDKRRKRTRSTTRSFLAMMPNISSQEPLSRLETSSPARLQNALHKFSLWLTSHTIDHSPRLAQLAVQSLSTRIHQKALEQLVQTYKWFCEQVKSPENKYEAAATLLGSERPFGQVHLLYQIFGIEEVESEEESEEGDGEGEVDEDGEDEDGDEEDDEEDEDGSEDDEDNQQEASR